MLIADGPGKVLGFRLAATAAVPTPGLENFPLVGTYYIVTNGLRASRAHSLLLSGSQPLW